MRSIVLLLFLLLPDLGYCANVLGPADFEQIWVLNNQRNLIKRYQTRTQQYLQQQRPLYQLDIDSTANQTIKTSAGDKDAILDRLGLHYQSSHVLFLADWLSLIPQPQTTEGFTYGDTVLGYSWQQNENLRFTLGGRLQSTPRSVLVSATRVFNLTNNASRDQLGGFMHVNYMGWDFGTYYSSQSGSQASSLYLPIVDNQTQQFSGAISYLAGDPDLSIASRYELSLDERYHTSDGLLQSGLTYALLSSSSAISNAYVTYDRQMKYGLNASGGVFYTYLPDSRETLPGAKLGISYTMQLDGELTMGVYIRENAFSDIDAMVVKNEPVFSFNMSARPRF